MPSEKTALWVQWADSSVSTFKAPVGYEVIEGALFVTVLDDSEGQVISRHVIASGKWNGLTLTYEDGETES